MDCSKPPSSSRGIRSTCRNIAVLHKNKRCKTWRMLARGWRSGRFRVEKVRFYPMWWIRNGVLRWILLERPMVARQAGNAAVHL